MKLLLKCLVGALLFMVSVTQLTAQTQNYLTTTGNKLYDVSGKEVRLTGVNWFGFETQNYSPHGIWSRDMKSVLQQIKDLGFNTVRVPWCNEMLDAGVSVNINSYGTDPYSGVTPMNEEEAAVSTPIELLDIFVDWCQENDMKIVLDNHSRAADAFLVEGGWYTEEYSEERWINDWIFMAERYKGKSTVVAMDLNNEPHGSTWGDGDPSTDWNKAAERCGNAVLAVNPDVLIIIEGVGEFEGDTYWWGGQLKGAASYPITLSDPNKLMYSAHEYGPEVFTQEWFEAADFPNNMPDVWYEHFDYLYEENTSPIFVGEFGIKEQDAANGIAYTWFTEFMDFMGDKYSWTFWAFNPNSGDTGGILQDDWTNVNQWKLDVLTPHVASIIPNVIDGDTEENNAPIANLTVNSTTGIVPVDLIFDASASSDSDGDTLSYTIDYGDGTSESGAISTHTYTFSGNYTAIVTVSDGNGGIDTDSVNVTVSDSVVIDPIVVDPVVDTPTSGSCTFDTPISTSLASLNTSYENIHVLGAGGPNMESITGFTLNWDLNNNGLYQFSFNLNTAPWYINFSSADQNFNELNPEINITASGINGLDGDYYATIDEGNFVLVSTDGYTIYFSNSAVAPDCKSSTANKSIGDNFEITAYPNPTTDLVTVYVTTLNGLITGKEVIISNLSGQTIETNTIEEGETTTVFSLENYPIGMYLVSVYQDSQIINSYKIVKE